MTEYNAAELRASAEAAAAAAARLAMKGFRSTDLVAVEKADNHDLVTEDDSGCEQVIRTVLLERHPESAVLGEELGVQDTSGAALTWHVDPIDGTAAFATGLAMWCVCIGAEVDGEMVAGVVFDPVAQQMFTADGAGAYLNGLPVRAEGRTDARQATVFAHFPWPRDLWWAPDQALEQFREVTATFATVRSVGSGALAMCYIAAGWADALFSHGANAWDVAASSFILRQAGGEFATYRAGEPCVPAWSHHGSHYVASVRGGDFPLLHDIVRHQSGRDLAS